MKPGITWTRRTKSEFSPRFLPAGCIFSEKVLSAFVKSGSIKDLAAALAVLSSRPCRSLIEVKLAAADKSQAGGVANSYEVGIIKSTPAPAFDNQSVERLSALARRAWSLKRNLDTVEESSHAFVLPAALRARLGDFDPLAIEAELVVLQTEIDELAFVLYGFSKLGRASVEQSLSSDGGGNLRDGADDDEESVTVSANLQAGLLSWTVGVVAGHFDWRLATGEREPPAEPDPFDPLPAKSPGMLPDGAEPLHGHAGILVDDPGHPHDLPRLIESVLAWIPTNGC